MFTIRQHPLTGVGFGKKFYIIFPLADISFFEFWEYITHNSILWIWVKTGVLGFIALLAMVGYTIMEGIRVTFALQDRDLKTVGLTLTLFVVMYFIYGYVDFAWEGQSMLYIGAAFGMLNSMERVDDKPREEPVLLGPDESAIPGGANGR